MKKKKKQTHPACNICTSEGLPSTTQGTNREVAQAQLEDLARDMKQITKELGVMGTMATAPWQSWDPSTAGSGDRRDFSGGRAGE